jgi:hypothetical protein
VANFIEQLKKKQAAKPAVKRPSFEEQMLGADSVASTGAAATESPAPKKNSANAVFEQYAPLVHREVSRWEASGLPRVVLEAEAKRLMAQSLPSYDPAKGTLGTHFTNHLRKLDGFVMTHRSDVRMPLDRAYMRNKAITAQADLRLELGTEPTPTQIAQRLGVAPHRLGDLHRAQTSLYSATEAAGANQPAMEQTGHREMVLDFLHHDFSPVHKVVFEHTVGYKGAPVLSGQQLAEKLKVTPARIQALRTEIAEQTQRYTRAVDYLRS